MFRASFPSFSSASSSFKQIHLINCSSPFEYTMYNLCPIRFSEFKSDTRLPKMVSLIYGFCSLSSYTAKFIAPALVAKSCTSRLSHNRELNKSHAVYRTMLLSCATISSSSDSIPPMRQKSSLLYVSVLIFLTLEELTPI